MTAMIFTIFLCFSSINARIKPINKPVSHSIDRQKMNSILDKGPQFLLSQLIPVPVLQKKKFIGFRLTVFFPGIPDIKTDVIKKGDIILNINGMSIERPDQYMYIFKKIRKSNKLKIDLIRNNQKKTVIFDIVPSNVPVIHKIKIKKK